MRILIAEDDQVLADGLLRTLRASGAAVDHVRPRERAHRAALVPAHPPQRNRSRRRREHPIGLLGRRAGQRVAALYYLDVPDQRGRHRHAVRP